MEPAKESRWEKGRHPRSRSPSYDSEEERERRRRRRRERELADREGDRSGRREGVKDRYDERDRKHRRSRSPAPESTRRRHEDHDRRHRHSSARSPAHRSSKDGEPRSSREGSATHASRRSKGALPSQAASFQANIDPSMAVVVAGDQDLPEKQKPTLAATGLLAAESNSVAQVDGTAIVLKYHEPPEARKPPAKDEWKLFVFKGSDILETIELSRRSCWLIGRELAVVDMAAEHPSISKQHAVIQFRYIEKKNEFGDKVGKVRPYLIDLDSANGTLLNKEALSPSRYVELRDKDMVQFGHSTREYVLMLPPRS